MTLAEITKKFSVSLPTLRKWIYKNEAELTKERIVAIFENKERRTIRILDEKKLEDFFFKEKKGVNDEN